MAVTLSFDVPPEPRVLGKNTEPHHLCVSWDAFEESFVRLVEKIKTVNLQFDTILCIGRGGLILGDALSRVFKERTFAVILARSYRGDNGTEQGVLEVSDHIAVIGELGKQVLLVDDMVDTGNTLLDLTVRIKEGHPHIKNISTAVLFQKIGSAFEPTCFGDLVEKGIWIVMPTERYETIPIETLIASASKIKIG